MFPDNYGTSHHVFRGGAHEDDLRDPRFELCHPSHGHACGHRLPFGWTMLSRAASGGWRELWLFNMFNMYMYTYNYIYIYNYIYTCLLIYDHIWSWSMCIYIYTYCTQHTHIYIYILLPMRWEDKELRIWSFSSLRVRESVRLASKGRPRGIKFTAINFYLELGKLIDIYIYINIHINVIYTSSYSISTIWT